MSFWYLASPYSKYVGGREQAFGLACRAAGLLMRSGVPVFSPIAHTHPIHKFSDFLHDADHAFWMNADRPMMEAAKGLIVLTASGWDDSVGVTEEIETFKAAGKPIVCMTPGIVPAAVLPPSKEAA